MPKDTIQIKSEESAERVNNLVTTGAPLAIDTINTQNETPPNQTRTDQPQAAPNLQKKTVGGFAKVWLIFWIVGNIAAALAPVNFLSNSRLAGVVTLVMLLSAVTATGYFLLYHKNHIGLYMILIANLLGVFMNNTQVSGYSINVTTGLIIGIITYFVTRKQVAYPFLKSPVTK